MRTLRHVEILRGMQMRTLPYVDSVLGTRVSVIDTATVRHANNSHRMNLLHTMLSLSLLRLS